MASTNQILIFGLFLTFTTFTVAEPPPGYRLTESFLECRRRCNDLLEPTIRCVSEEFSPDKEYKTRRLYNTTTACLECKHVCRRRQQIWECIRQGAQIMKEFSNKSKIMVSPTVQLAETIANYFCDNEKEMFLGLTDEDMSCLNDGWEYCNPNLDFISNLDAVALCDFEDPHAANLYTMEYVCKKSADYFDCSIDSVSACSNRLATTFTILKSKLLTSDSCAQYNVMTNELR